MEKYTLKVDDGKTQIEETIEIDTEKETETFEIPSDGDTSPRAAGDVKIVYDFKQVMIWERGIDFCTFANLFPNSSLTCQRFLCACSPILPKYLYHNSPVSYACPQP